MILVLLWWRKDALSSKVKKDNCWSEQSPEKSTVSTVPFSGGHPVYEGGMKSALLWQKEASDIPSKFELLMFS